MPAWTMPSKTFGKNAGKAEKSVSWWQPMLSAWVSTSPMYVSCCISTCPIHPRPIFRKPDVPEETERKLMPSSCTPNRTKPRCTSAYPTLFRRKTISKMCTSIFNTTTRWQWETDWNAYGNSTSRISAVSSSTSPSRWTAH